MPNRTRLLTFGLLFLTTGFGAVAATFPVSVFTDSQATASGSPSGTGDGPGATNDLRYSILMANSTGGSNTITFPGCTVSAPCEITLNGPLPPITSDLTIDGGTFGAVIISGNNLYRVFFVDSGTVLLANLQIQSALAQGGNGGSSAVGPGGGGAGFGAGLFVNQASADVTLRNAYFLDCQVVGGNGGSLTGSDGGAGGGGLRFNGATGAAGGGGGGGGGVSGAGSAGTLSAGGAGGNGGGGGGTGLVVGTGGAGGGAYGTNTAGSAGGLVSSGQHPTGGNGGFGGGGGGGGGGSTLQAGVGGNGGFGGGGGGAGLGGSAGTGGYGGGNGGNSSNGGAGGDASGPAVFVNLGALTVQNSGASTLTATAGNGGSGAPSGAQNSLPVFNYGGTINFGGTSSSSQGGIMALPNGLPAASFSVSFPNPIVSYNNYYITVTALNSNGQATAAYQGTSGTCNGESIVFSTNNSNPILQPCPYTFTNGVYSSSGFVLKTAGTGYTITVTDNVTPSITGTSGPITVNPNVLNSLSVSLPSSAIMGTPFTFTVTGQDLAGNTETTNTDLVKITSSDSAAALPAKKHRVAGSATFTITLNTYGNQTITATDLTSSGINGTSTILVNNAPAASFRISAPATATAETPFNITVTALTAQGATATAYTGTFHFTSTDNLSIFPGNSTLTNGVGTFSALLNTPGGQTITVTDNYNGATGTSGTITVSAASQTIAFSPATTSYSFSAGSFTVSATASSGLAVSFASTTMSVCTVSGSTVTLVSVGTCTIQASQTGNTSYNAATPVPVNFTISQASQTITFNPGLTSYSILSGSFTVSATASSGLAVSFASTTTGVCTVSGGNVTLLSGGTCTIKASQTGNSDYTAATPVSVNFTITQASQTITFPTISDMPYGTAPFTVTATASSGLLVSLTSTTQAVCTVSGLSISVVGVGMCTIQAAQAGNNSYSAAPSVTRSFTVTTGNQTITFNPATTSYQLSAGTFTVSATASSGLPVSFAHNHERVYGLGHDCDPCLDWYLHDTGIADRERGLQCGEPCLGKLHDFTGGAAHSESGGYLGRVRGDHGNLFCRYRAHGHSEIGQHSPRGRQGELLRRFRNVLRGYPPAGHGAADERRYGSIPVHARHRQP
jgi:hypothetical protein